ncbi:MAG TPA: adenylate/guanylate cyclase domain-containing protein [Stellaceae bacterium]|nr:adenylate/guanylate cyclase domain-containing protein [Stellaceae bacterium]
MVKLPDRRDTVTAEKRVERRLAAIMAADVVGYSRLMGADEIGTLRALSAHRRELIDPTIAARHGRIVKTTGDGVLVEFPSAVEAVACAISVQQGIALRNAGVAEDKRLIFRVGINVGDIISEAGDIFGDGVNVAARLESLCEPGGLCISRAVRDQVRDKLPVTFDDLGEQQVKNIARPVRAFGLTAEAIAATPELSPQTLTAPGGRSRPWVIAVLVAVILAAGGATWWIVRAPPVVTQPSGPTAISPLPIGAARASIAVLPLEALGAEGGSDYFADGLTEDIISALGRFRELSVMSLGAVFAYKGKHPSPMEVGRDLKVRYVVDGSIRRAPERIRVAVSLTDTDRSAVLWSEKYDAEPKDIFAVQDQITRRISGALALQVTGLELARSATKPPNNLEAYDLVLRGRGLLSSLTRSANAQARALFERAIALDPNYAPAYVGLGQVDMRAANQGWTQDPGEALERAEKLAQKAITLDDLSSNAHALLGDAAVQFGDFDRALGELKRAIDLNGSDAESYDHLVAVLLYRGDTAGAIAAGELVAQFQPELPDGTAFNLGIAYILADRGADAVRILERAIDRNPGLLVTNVMLAAAYAAAGREQEAGRQAERVHQRFPTFSRDRFGSAFRDPTLRAKLNQALEKAGL